MTLLRSTFTLYRESAVDAARGLVRGVWGVVALVLAFLVLLVLIVIGQQLGLAGGFLVGIGEAFLAGWYLSLVAIGVLARRRIRASDLWDNVGSLFVEVISVLFLFWIARLVLQMSAPGLLMVVIPVATLVFNPVPEMVYQERSQSFALLGDALRFMQHNWPEWLGAQLLGAAFLALWAWLVLGGAPDPAAGLDLIQSFGPWFGFIRVGGIALGGLTGGGILGAVVILVFTHFFLLFRGHLYRRLAGSSRRSRAWQSRM